MDSNKTWILIANASTAHVFAVFKTLVFKEPTNTRNLESIATFAHENSRKKGRDLISDRLGNFGSGTFVEPTDPKAHEAEVFAIELLTYLDAARVDKKFRDLIFVTPPDFMGLLLKHASNPLKKLITQTIEKDYTKQTGAELIGSLLSHW